MKKTLVMLLFQFQFMFQMECCRLSFCFRGPFSDAEQTKSVVVFYSYGILVELQLQPSWLTPKKNTSLSTRHVCV